MTIAAAIVGSDAVLGAIGRAATIAFSAYVLQPGGDVERALASAADRGARVDVTLPAFQRNGTTSGLAHVADRTASDLRRHGAHVSIGVPNGDVVHLKAAVCDGTAYLDDRNWASRDQTVVATDDPARVSAVRDATRGRTSTAAGFATEKEPALRLEADAIRAGCGDCVDVASESFGAGTVSAALRERAIAGAHVRLLVNAHIAFGGGGRERAVLRSLQRDGVDVRASTTAEKLCVAGDRGWVGSANATFDAVPTTDWGLAVDAGPMLDTLAATFARAWDAATPMR